MLNIDNLIKEALKAKKPVELKVYRNLKSDILAFKTQKNAPEYTEEQEIKIIQKYAKKLEDFMGQFSNSPLCDEYKEELEVLKKHLPEPVCDEDLVEYIMPIANEKGWFNDDNKLTIPKKEMGNLVKELKSAFPGANGKDISEFIKANLG